MFNLLNDYFNQLFVHALNLVVINKRYYFILLSENFFFSLIA